MKYFDSVAIACSTASLDCALAIRSALEWFRLRVNLYHCVQSENALDFIAGRIPPCDYVVLVTHGLGRTNHDDETPDEMAMGFPDLVFESDGEWQSGDFALTPANIPNIVNLEGRTIIATGCGAGREAFGKAFLESGCKAYIAPDGEVNEDATMLYPVTFFYNLLSASRPEGGECSVKEAAERAAKVDTVSKEGTHVFRYYGQE